MNETMTFGLGSRREQADDPLAMLVACHGRIRRFGQAALRLAQVQDPPPWEVAHTARNLLRYYDEALPLHEQDEEVDLTRLLRARRPGRHVEPALRALEREHREIEAVLAELMPWWRRLADVPERLLLGRPRLALLTERFTEKMTAHLAMEEAVILPAARELLTDEDMDALAWSMRDRRRGYT